MTKSSVKSRVLLFRPAARCRGRRMGQIDVLAGNPRKLMGMG
jgi:hypothetical protein